MDKEETPFPVRRKAASRSLELSTKMAALSAAVPIMIKGRTKHMGRHCFQILRGMAYLNGLP